MKHITVDHITNSNQVWTKSAVVSEDMFTVEEWNALLNGKEIPMEWSEDGTPYGWYAMSEEDEI